MTAEADARRDVLDRMWMHGEYGDDNEEDVAAVDALTGAIEAKYAPLIEAARAYREAHIEEQRCFDEGVPSEQALAASMAVERAEDIFDEALLAFEAGHVEEDANANDA